MGTSVVRPDRSGFCGSFLSASRFQLPWLGAGGWDRWQDCCRCTLSSRSASLPVTSFERIFRAQVSEEGKTLWERPRRRSTILERAAPASDRLSGHDAWRSMLRRAALPVRSPQSHTESVQQLVYCCMRNPILHFLAWNPFTAPLAQTGLRAYGDGSLPLHTGHTLLISSQPIRHTVWAMWLQGHIRRTRVECQHFISINVRVCPPPPVLC